MDPATNPTPAPAPAPTQAPSGGGGYSVPDGYALVPKEFQTNAERWREQIAPGQKWAEIGKKAGFEKPDDFGEWAEFIATARKNKANPRALASIYADDEPVQHQPTSKSLTEEQVRAMIGDETALVRAEGEYKELSARERAQLDSMVDELAGAEADPYQKSLLKRALNYEAAMARAEYEEQHPLRKKGYFKPLDEQGFGSLRERLTKERDEAKAASLAKKGAAAANKQAPMISTPAGSSGGQGKPDTNGQSKVPFHKLSRAERIAAAEEMKSKRGSSTLA